MGKRIIGIDPGSDVALCLLPGDDGSRLVRLVRAGEKGLDEPGLRAALVELRPELAIVEKVGVMPGQGQTSGSTFMVSWGLIRGVLVGLGVPYLLVAPLKWKNRLLTGYYMGPPIPKEEPPRGLKGPGLKVWLEEAKQRLRKAKEERKAAQKAAAVAFIAQRYPSINLVPKGCRTENHNLAEAVCLAAYGELEHGDG